MRRCTNMLRFNSMTQSYVAASYVAGMRSACALGPFAHIKVLSYKFTGTYHSSPRIQHNSDQNKLVEKGKHCRLTQKLCTDHVSGMHCQIIRKMCIFNRSSSKDHQTRISHPINTYVSPDRWTDLPWTDRAIRRILAPVAPYRESRRIAGNW